MSSANRERRQRNQAARAAAVEDAQRRARRQRITVAAVGIALAVVVGIALVARATSGNNGSAGATTTTSSTPATSTTLPVKPQRCVAMQKPPAGTPVVPVVVGPAPKKLETRDLIVGTGPVVKAGSTITVDYVGVVCSTGKTFGSSFGSQPLQLSLSQSIPGWQRGVPGMRVGGTRLLGLPPALGYGATGTPDGAVPPNEALWFLVKLEKLQPAATTTTAVTTTTGAATTTTAQPSS